MTSSRPSHQAAPAHPEPIHSPPPRTIYQILAGRLFDPIERTLVPNQVITVDADAGLVLDVSSEAAAAVLAHEIQARSTALAQAVHLVAVDLGTMTVLPGLVDVHVHLFLHPYAETPWEAQLTGESLAERTVRATVHARRTLLAGFTTVRDLGTEGAFDADIALRKCMAGQDPIIPGPRYYCATRAINSTGAYGPKSSLYPAQQGIDGVNGAEPVDGVDACVREVRRQIGAGADWIKIYADYSCRSRLSDVSPALGVEAIATFNKVELKAMIDTAHARGVKVAAHANTAGAVDMLLDLGVDSIEHGTELYDACAGDSTLLRKFIRANGRTTWVPTLGAYYTMFATSAPGSSAAEHARGRWAEVQAAFAAALRADMENIACGGDTGVFAHGRNALELVLMRRLGAPWDRVLSWATYGGWKCVRGMEWEGDGGARRLAEINQAAAGGRTGGRPEQRAGLERGVPFGVLRAGWAADLVGVVGPLDGSVSEFEEALTTGVSFVMKGGRVYKESGREVLH